MVMEDLEVQQLKDQCSRYVLIQRNIGTSDSEILSTIYRENRFPFNVLEPINELTINVKYIDIKHASLKVVGSDSDKVYNNLVMEFDNRWETVTFKCPFQVPAGDAELTLSFTGVLNDQMLGFYRSKWIDSNKQEQFLATTQFASTSARRAFPCWDEPALKATFDFTITVPKDLVAISCMDEISCTENDNLKTVKFGTTPAMSTYLLAFAVGKFDFIEGKTRDGTRVRVYTTAGKSNQGQFALDVCLKALPFYSEYFGISYVLPKCDLLAVPDFSFGAMENWGLIMYREVYLLHDPEQNSASGKESIALTVAHELAHMWFGNLATMEWWTDIWLNEGYATFMQYFFVDKFYPDFDIWTRFINNETLRSMILDALRSSHPIEIPINNPEEISEIFDAISYAKSSCIIRMLHSYLGDSTFRSGLASYLKKYSFKSAVTLDLWNALSKSSGQDVAMLMKNWTLKMGYPVVTVSERQDGDCRILTLTQQRFIADGSADTTNTVWQVLVTISSESMPNEVLQRALFGESSMQITIPNMKPGKWLKLNTQLCGYYRVQYSEEMLKALVPAVIGRTLEPADRFNIVNDLFALVCAGKASTVEYLNVISKMSEEEDYNVLSDIGVSIEKIANVLERTTDLKLKFDSFCCKMFEKLGAKYGWDAKKGETHIIGLLRPLIIGVLGRSGHPQFVKEARIRFNDHISGKITLPANIRRQVFAIVVENQGNSAYQAVRKGGHVRLQDIYLVCIGLVTSMEGQDTMWNYFSNNYDELIRRFGTASCIPFQNILKLSIKFQCSEQFVAKAEKFFDGCPDKITLSRPFAQSIENVRLNAALLKRDQLVIRNWLNAQGF